MEKYVASGEHVEAWQVAKWWYRGVTGRPPPPAREDMEAREDVYQELYTATTPYGSEPQNQPTVDDEKPTTYEIIQAIKKLRNGRPQA
jgi:hypothetical protein